MPEDIPTFEQWLDYCLTLGHHDFEGRDGEVSFDRLSHFTSPPPSLIAEYLARLCASPAALAHRCTDTQLADAIWFLFGVGSCAVGHATSASRTAEQRTAFIRSLSGVYTEVFDRVCGHQGEDPDEPLYNSSPVDGAVYMLWDMDQLLPAVRKDPLLLDPAAEVLRHVLQRCLTSSCLISSLHALGHLIWSSDRYDPDPPTSARLRGIIDEFLARRRPPTFVSEYASHAREGRVQ